jgi:hypothetical protein
VDELQTICKRVLGVSVDRKNTCRTWSGEELARMAGLLF